MYLIMDAARTRAAIDSFRRAKFSGAAEENAFFEGCGIENSVETIDRPFERLNDCELLMSQLQGSDPLKYATAHKGTPFGFMSWFAFDLCNYEKALFYLDAGISEDLKNFAANGEWLNLPGARFLRLDANPANPWLRRTGEVIRGILERELLRFQEQSGQPLDLNSWQRLIDSLLRGRPSEWTLISALYVFLMEFEDRCRELTLRGPSGGSNQPLTVHLFTGGLLFESLLKHYYKQPNGDEYSTIEGPLMHCDRVSVDFFGGRKPFKARAFQACTLAEIYDAIEQGDPLEVAFRTTARLRNATGHNLVRDNIFGGPEKYRRLAEQVINALLYVITKVTA